MLVRDLAKGFLFKKRGYHAFSFPCMTAAFFIAFSFNEVRASTVFDALFGSGAQEETRQGQDYSITIFVETADNALAERLRAASVLFAERDESPPPSAAALLGQARTEYAHLLGALYREGFYGGTITVTVNGRDVFAIAPDAALPDRATVAITIDPGARFSFGEITIKDRAPVSETNGESSPLQEVENFAPGAPARAGRVLAAEAALITEWRRQGYPKAQIETRNVVAHHPSHRLDVMLDVESGPSAVFGPLTIAGTKTVDPAFIAWMTGLRPGSRYDSRALEEAERRLYRLQVFSSVDIAEAETVGADGSLPLTVTAIERPLRLFGLGGSFSSIDGLSTESYWEHRNLFGRAERLRLDGRVSGIASTDPQDYEYFLGSTFTKPGVVTPLTDLATSLTLEQNRFEGYRERTARARGGLTHEAFQNLTLSLFANIEATEIDDFTHARFTVLASLPAEAVYDGRNDRLEPTEGIRARLAAEPLYIFGASETALILDTEASTYVAADKEERFVLALRGATGSILGATRDDIPRNRLFFRGGGGSIRGYAYRNVAPRANGIPLGGLSYAEGSLEVRARVSKNIGLVPFIDAGAAFDSAFPDFSEEIKIGAGVGLRYYTSLGPIRADLAFPLNPEEGDPSFGLYIGLGQSF